MLLLLLKIISWLKLYISVKNMMVKNFAKVSKTLLSSYLWMRHVLWCQWKYIHSLAAQYCEPTHKETNIANTCLEEQIVYCRPTLSYACLRNTQRSMRQLAIAAAARKIIASRGRPWFILRISPTFRYVISINNNFSIPVQEQIFY